MGVRQQIFLTSEKVLKPLLTHIVYDHSLRIIQKGTYYQCSLSQNWTKRSFLLFKVKLIVCAMFYLNFHLFYEENMIQYFESFMKFRRQSQTRYWTTSPFNIERCKGMNLFSSSRTSVSVGAVCNMSISRCYEKWPKCQ